MHPALKIEGIQNIWQVSSELNQPKFEGFHSKISLEGIHRRTGAFSPPMGAVRAKQSSFLTMIFIYSILQGYGVDDMDNVKSIQSVIPSKILLI